ncbi:GNAT family N-acetyltransferase [Chloroflexota bacterium]
MSEALNNSNNILVKHLTPNNIGALASLTKRAADDSYACLPGTILGLSERFTRPGFLAEKHVLLAWHRNRFVGFVEIIPEGVIQRATLNLWVAPDFRHIGVGKALINKANQVCREEELNFLHVFASENNQALHLILNKIGFTLRRRFIGMLLDIKEAKENRRDYDGLQATPLLPGQEGMLAKLQNAVFAGSWGYNPNTSQTISYSLSFSQCSLSDVRIVANEPGEALAYCWVNIPPPHDQPNGTTFGRVSMMGVLPSERGKGLAKMALENGIAYLRSKNAAYVELTVDANNVPARRLYRRAGFIEDHVTICFEKQVIM